MFCPVASSGRRGARQAVTEGFHVERLISIFVFCLVSLVPPVDLLMKTAEIKVEDIKQFCS